MYSKTPIYDDNEEMWLKYWISFYYAVFMLLGEEISPRNTLEAATSGFLLLIGAVLTAVMFGTMTVLMSSLNRKRTTFQETLDVANTTMKNMKLSTEL